jgi:hypothetical protein
VRVLLSKIGMVRAIMIMVFVSCIVGGVLLGIQVKQVIFQDSSDEDYD